MPFDQDPAAEPQNDPVDERWKLRRGDSQDLRKWFSATSLDYAHLVLLPSSYFRISMSTSNVSAQEHLTSHFMACT